MKLSDRQKSFLQLISRSPDRGDGWRSVGRVLWDHVVGWASDMPELIEVDKDTYSLRFTPEGKIVVRYLS